MSEYIIVAMHHKTVVSFRCNRENVADLIKDYFESLGWSATWFRDPPLIGQVTHVSTP